MYTKPQVVKFGTLRELTQLGTECEGDGAIIFGNGSDWSGCGGSRTS